MKSSVYICGMPVQKVTRDEILQRSMQVFKRQGYHGTSMDDLAKACGLQKGSFYHYFGSKEALMKEVLAHFNAQNVAGLFAIAYDDSVAPEIRLTQLLDTLFSSVLRTKGGCLMGKTVLETSAVTDAFKDPLRTHFTNAIQAISHIYGAVYPAEQALKLGRQVTAEIQGALMMTNLFENEQWVDDCRERALQWLRESNG